MEESRIIRAEDVARCLDMERLIADVESGTTASIRMIPIVSLLDSTVEPSVNIMSSDVSQPPIVLRFGKERLLLLTGKEQVFKAKILGFQSLDCLVLRAEVCARYVIDSHLAEYCEITGCHVPK